MKPLIASVVLFTFTLFGCQDSMRMDEGSNSTIEIKESWQYSESIDQLTNQKQYFALTTSTNEVQFQFPYNGGSKLFVYTRNIGNGNEVVFEISKGQFLFSINSSNTIIAKFDDDKPIEFTYSNSGDGSPNIIFLDSSKRFLTKLKKSKKMMVRITFYNEGYKDFYFNIEGLKWKH